MSSLEGGGKSGPERVRGDAISCRMGEQRNGIRSRTWMDVRSAFAWGERQAQETPDKRFWLEKQRKVLFIIPLAPDHVALPVRNTAGMRIGDIVRYHLPIWPQNKSKTGTLKRVYGNSFVVVDDMLMDVACVIEVSPSQRDT